MCLLYAPSPAAPLYDLCLQQSRIPAGRVLHTDHQEEGDVEHADVRSPPHTEHKGHCWIAHRILKRFFSLSLSFAPVPFLLRPSPATITQHAPSINCLLNSITLAGIMDLLPFFSQAKLGGCVGGVIIIGSATRTKLQQPVITCKHVIMQFKSSVPPGRWTLCTKGKRFCNLRENAISFVNKERNQFNHKQSLKEPLSELYFSGAWNEIAYLVREKRKHVYVWEAARRRESPVRLRCLVFYCAKQDFISSLIRGLKKIICYSSRGLTNQSGAVRSILQLWGKPAQRTVKKGKKNHTSDLNSTEYFRCEGKHYLLPPCAKKGAQCMHSDKSIII